MKTLFEYLLVDTSNAKHEKKNSNKRIQLVGMRSEEKTTRIYPHIVEIYQMIYANCKYTQKYHFSVWVPLLLF